MEIAFGEYFIRSLREEDVPALAKYADNPKIAAQVRDHFPHPYTETDARAWVERTRSCEPQMSFAIATAEELIGAIGLVPQKDVHRRSAEIGYWLAEPYWGRGVASAAVEALTDWAFAHLDLVRLYATVFETNPASARVLEKAGYDFEGRLRRSVVKLGRTMDSLLYARVREASEETV